MKTNWSLHLLVVLSLLLAALPAPAASAAAADLLQFSSGGHALGFDSGGMYAATGSHALHVDFAGAHSIMPQSASQEEALPRMEADGNPEATQGRAVLLSQVTYTNLWDGISLAYTAQAGSLYTTTYTLKPGANPADIRLRYNLPPSLNKDGSLGIAFETGFMIESAPLAWQEIKGQRVAVEAAFRVSGQDVSFALGAYNPGYALTIDPSLYWNTFLGGASDDTGFGVALDGNGNIYVTGESNASWSNPVRNYTGRNDAFVAKLDSSGALLWNTFLGGSNFDRGFSIAVDGSGAYVTGESDASWGSPLQAYAGGNSEAFVAKLNASTGSLTWNTFLGGGGSDVGNTIAVDGIGKVYVTGYSNATWGSPGRAYSIGYDAFGAKLEPSGTLIGNTFLGGNGDDFGTGIAVDGSANIYVTGYSSATWGSPVRAYIGSHDAFAAKLNASGGGLDWNTFLGGSDSDFGISIAVDAGGSNLYVSGYSFGTWGSPLRAYTAGYDSFAVKLNASSGGLTWNTFLGGSGSDQSQGIGLDGSGNVYVAGYSNASWGSPLHAYAGGYDTFVTKLNASGGLTWNTFRGGSGSDYGYGIAVAGGNVYLAGSSSASWGSPLQPYTGGNDALAAKLNSSGALTWSTFLGGGGSDAGNSIAVDGSGNIYVTGSSNAYWGSPVRSYSDNADAFVAKLNVSGTLTWSTFMGGSGDDQGFGISVDGSGNVYVAGTSSGSWGNPQQAYAGGSYDAFAAKLNASTGALDWNTFLGGGGTDYGYTIVAETGGINMTGYSNASWGSPLRAYTGGMDAFAAKLNAATGALVGNTFLGGGGDDIGKAIAVGSGNFYITGYSTAAWTCTAPCTVVRAYTAGWEAFVAKLDSSGGLTWITFLGGSGDDSGNGIAVDGSGNVYVAGGSSATWGTPKRPYNANYDGFAAKLNSSGGLIWNTFLGSSGYDDSPGLAVDGSGNIYLTGYSSGSWGSPVRAYTGGMDAFAARLNSSGVVVLNTFLGGSGHQYGNGIALDGNRNVFVTGLSSASWGSPVRAYTGGEDAFAAKLDLTPPTVVSSLRADANPTNAASVHFTVTFSEVVTGVDTADFTLTASGITSAAVGGVSGSGSVYSVTVSTGSGSGTLELNVIDNDTILDARSNPLGGTGLVNGNFTSGEAYTIRPCYTLTLTHTGTGSNPTATPPNSSICASGRYLAGEAITLTAHPAGGWLVSSWSGTSNNSSKSLTNSLSMPAGTQTATANYILAAYRIYLPLVRR